MQLFDMESESPNRSGASPELRPFSAVHYDLVKVRSRSARAMLCMKD
jgi:hypothetical protein